MVEFKILTKKTNLILLFIISFSFVTVYAQEKDFTKSDSNIVTLINDNNMKSVSRKIKAVTKFTSKIAKSAADTEPPILICPPNQKLTCGMLVPSYFDLLTVNDNLDTEIDVTQYPGEGSFFYDGMEIQFTAKDDAGNTSSCSIIVTSVNPDVAPPTFTCPTNIKLNCGDVIPNYAISPIMNLKDDCSINLKYKMTPAAGTIFYGNPTPIEIEYSDKTGNKSYCNFTITSNPDVIKPVISNCPGVQFLACGSVLPDYKTWVTVSDNCDGILIISQTPSPGTAFTPGMTVTLMVKDASNNTSACSFVINASADTVKPVITNCPSNQTLAIGDAIPDYLGLIHVTDNCDTNPIVTQVPIPGTIFTSGTNVVISAKDTSGNISVCNFYINPLGGDLPPVLSCPSGMELYKNSTLPNYISYLTALSDDLTDNFDLIFTQTPPQGTLFTADTNVTITAKDASGNINFCTFLVKLKTVKQDIDCKTTSINVNNLYGDNGFSIYGEILAREAGFSVNNAGDVNGDGIKDLIIGAPGNYNPWYGASKIYKIIPGAAYVIFGKASGFAPNIDLGLLDGTNGFAIRNDISSSNFPLTGYDVSSAGDINGDGIGDFMVSDPYRHSSYGPEAGHTYIIFGKKSGFPAEIKLSSLNGSNGFTLIGNENYAATGSSIDLIGDINSDGFQDIAVITSGSGAVNGKCFVVYGRAGGFPAILRTFELNGTNGFTIEGDASTGKLGRSVSGLGDVNGDGIVDIALGSYNGSDQKRKYVVFGRSNNFPANFNISALNGTNGFIIENSETALDSYNGIEKAGDLNNDGINDIAITGQYVLFGKTVFPVLVDLKNLDGTNGFKINGVSAGNSFGYAGDFNGDTIDDFFVHDPGTTYIFFGKKVWTATVSPSTDKNFRIMSDYLYEYSVNYAGDVNNDGVGDIIIGNPYNSYGSNLKVNYNPGKAFVVFGKKVTDTQKPVIANCPSNEVVSTGFPIPDYKNVITVTDNCDSNPTITQVPAPWTIFDGVTKDVTLTVTDKSGNFEICTFKISNDADAEAPVLTCLSDQLLNCKSLVPNYLNLVTVSDNKDTAPILTQDPIAGTAFTDGMVITITAKDVSNNSSTCSFKVNASADVTAPVIACIGDQTLSCGSTIPDYTLLVTANDNCDASPVITQNPIAGSVFTDGMAITITAKDASNNEAYCSFKVNASADLTAPVIACIGDQILSCGSTIPDYTLLVTANDNCDPYPVITQNPSVGSVFTDGMAITITAKDISNNSSTCSFKVNASADVTAPVIACIGDQTLSCGSIIPDYTALITVTDNCDASPVITQNPIAGSVFTDGMAITITAKDVSNNSSTCSFKVNASADVTAPVIACIGDQTLSCGSTIPDYTLLVTANDNCDASPVITQNPIAGTAFTDGMDITITAKDASNNESYCSFKVNASADVTAPVIACIGDQTLSCGSKIPDYTLLVTANDNCDSYPVIAQNPSAGTAFTDGMAITITAKDVSNNSSTCSFKVNASADVTAPVIACIGDQTLSCGSIIPDYTLLVTANDNCDSYPVITQNPSAGSVFTDGMEITITARDVSNNSSTCSFKVNASPDITAPSITCIADQNLNIADVLPDYRTMITATDNCDSNLTVTQIPSSGSNVTDGMNVTINASDNSGNSTSCTFKINVAKDAQPPVFTCIADQMFDCSVSQVPDYTKMIFATDNADPNPVITQYPAPGAVFLDGMTITIKVSDKSNNVSGCSFQLFSYPIFVDAGEDAEINQGDSIQLYAIALEDGVFSWSPATGLNNSKIGNPIAKPSETTTYKVVFTNKEGCETEDLVTVTVIPPIEKDETKYGFSPNGDGINDFWEIDGITDYPENEVLIYSRWGDLVYHTKGYDNATNVFSGIANKSRNLGANQLPEGTYFFEIRVNQPHHFKKTKGYLVLKR
ncbi:HYR domain protein [Flavobacterium anhuiense]|uniref:HYR domain protein n=2 Tax=Flavobacterium anhuiense TaxID=459526 RepID=A0AAC9D1A6_9FLAO|nr:HYR domain protein [Flavobacterium anhuiense]